VLDEHFTAKWEALGPAWTRAKHRRTGVPTMRIVRYADDFLVMVHGTRDDADALWAEVTAVLAPMGLRLSEEKTRVCHIDEGFDFLGHADLGVMPTSSEHSCSPGRNWLKLSA